MNRLLLLLAPLQEVIRKSPGRTAREYSQKLQNMGIATVDRSAVNSALYKNTELFDFCRDNEGAPRWFLKTLNPTPGVSGSAVQNKIKKIAAPVAGIILYDWQKDALKKWQAQKFRGVVEAVTGAGKTRVGISAAIDEIERGGYVLVVVPSLELLRQWETVLKEYLPQVKTGIFGGGRQATFDDCRLIIATVHAARYWELRPPAGKGGLLIADECHRYGSECNKEALDERFKRRLGLSATYQRSDNGNADWLEPFFGKTCFTLGYERAIKDGVISRFAVAMLGTAFSETERAEYAEHTEKLKRLKKKLIGNFEVVAEPFGEFIKRVSLMAEGGFEQGTAIARSYLSAFEKRRALLAESPAKTKALLKLTGAIRRSNRTLIFTQTVESAENIAREWRAEDYDAAAVHSKMKMDERRRVLADFGAGALRVVVAPQVLDEGIDVPEADLAIIVAASKTRRQMIQRMGRVLRLKKDGRIARFAILFIEDTSEDPKTGAHEEFLNEITRVASSIERFDGRASAEKICRYLSQETDLL